LHYCGRQEPNQPMKTCTAPLWSAHSSNATLWITDCSLLAGPTVPEPALETLGLRSAGKGALWTRPPDGCASCLPVSGDCPGGVRILCWALAEAAICACAGDYALVRPVLLGLKRRHPEDRRSARDDDATKQPTASRSPTPPCARRPSRSSRQARRPRGGPCPAAARCQASRTRGSGSV